MSNHITEWLNAYLDGELKNGRLHQVEAHLAECVECQMEFESLQSLSSVLHEAPMPEFISSERFASQVSLRLPHELPKASKRKVSDVGWWMIPVSLLVLWILLSTSALVGRVFSTANEIGLLHGAPTWLVGESSHAAVWSERLGELGLLNGDNLKWVKFTESFTKSRLPYIFWQVSIALVYLSWITLWWARQSPQVNGQLLEG